MAQADESDRETSTQDGEIKSNEDGVATHIAAKDDYLVAPLEAVGGGGEGAVVPEGATLDRIDDFLILAFDPETTADELVERFREIAQTDETQRTFRTRGGKIKVSEDGVITDFFKGQVLFRPLQVVGGVAAVPEGARLARIGHILATMRKQLNPFLNNVEVKIWTGGENVSWHSTHQN